VLVIAGWEVSGRRAAAGLTLTDCTPLAKVQLRAPLGGRAAAELGVPFGRAARDGGGTLVAGSGPGEWLLLAAPGEGPALIARGTELAARCPGELITATDVTHGRALIRLSGAQGGDLLRKVCGIDLSDGITPDGAAFRSSVAAVATDVIRDDAGGTRSYLLHCERSSGGYLFGELLAAGSEFGIEIDGFTPPGI
jgi:heterotetrameric sarcosine oxidase gamma subunit